MKSQLPSIRTYLTSRMQRPLVMRSLPECDDRSGKAGAACPAQFPKRGFPRDVPVPYAMLKEDVSVYCLESSAPAPDSNAAPPLWSQTSSILARRDRSVERCGGEHNHDQNRPNPGRLLLHTVWRRSLKAPASRPGPCAKK